MSENLDPELIWRIDKAIILAIIVCGAIGGIFWFYTEPHTFSTNETILTKNGEPVWFVVYNFTADVFSAQNPIKVDAIAYLIPSYSHNHDDSVTNAQVLYVYLPTSSTVPPIYHYGVLFSTPLELDKTNTGSYSGSGTFVYQSEGDKYTIVSEKQLPSSPQRLNSTVPIIHISSADSLYALKTSQRTISLTFIGIAFTLVLLHDFIIGVLHNRARLGNRDNNTNDDNDKSNPKKKSKKPK